MKYNYQQILAEAENQVGPTQEARVDLMKSGIEMPDGNKYTLVGCTRSENDYPQRSWGNKGKFETHDHAQISDSFGAPIYRTHHWN